MKKPIDAARDLVDCFKWDFEGAITGSFDENKVAPGKTIPQETWAPVVIALRKFLNGECESLDEAFGNNTRSYRRSLSRGEECKIIKWLVMEYADEYKRLPKDEKQKGLSPKDFGIAKLAESFAMKETTVRDIYNGDR